MFRGSRAAKMLSLVQKEQEQEQEQNIVEEGTNIIFEFVNFQEGWLF